jgi:hypothetical protein
MRERERKSHPALFTEMYRFLFLNGPESPLGEKKRPKRKKKRRAKKTHTQKKKKKKNT